MDDKDVVAILYLLLILLAATGAAFVAYSVVATYIGAGQ